MYVSHIAVSGYVTQIGCTQVILFQVFLSNSNYNVVSSNYVYFKTVICLLTIIWFQATNNDCKETSLNLIFSLFSSVNTYVKISPVKTD